MSYHIVPAATGMIVADADFNAKTRTYRAQLIPIVAFAIWVPEDSDDSYGDADIMGPVPIAIDGPVTDNELQLSAHIQTASCGSYECPTCREVIERVSATDWRPRGSTRAAGAVSRLDENDAS